MPSSPTLNTIDFGHGPATWLTRPGTSLNTPAIHLSPANGFPVGSYGSFIQHLPTDFNITGMDCRGAWAGRSTPPKGFTMHDFANDLIRGIEAQHSAPVIGMGHSQGGLVTAIAAVKRPELFSHLILIDPASLPNKWVDLFYRRLPQRLIFAMFPFMRGSHERQAIWNSREDFCQRYRHHPTFKRFTKQALLDYAHYGLTETSNAQFELTFAPQWESHIFRQVEFLWKYLSKIQHKTLLIRAEHSNLYTEKQFNSYNQSLGNHIQALQIKDTYHLLTHETPELLSKNITNWMINKL